MGKSILRDSTGCQDELQTGSGMAAGALLEKIDGLLARTGIMIGLVAQALRGPGPEGFQPGQPDAVLRLKAWRAVHAPSYSRARWHRLSSRPNRALMGCSSP